MKPRSFAVLGLLLLCSATWAQAPVTGAWKPGSAPRPGGAPAVPADSAGAQRKPRVVYDGVPDTGQFLPDTAVLGRFDGRVFRVLEFRERWFAAYMPDRPRGDSAGRHEFLNSMVNKEVLAALAREVDRPLGFEDRAALRETHQRLMANAAFARFVLDSVRYKASDVQRVYDQGRHALHLQHIVADDPGSVERARADVLAGRLTWEQAVARYSNRRDDKGPDGDIGWVLRHELDFEPALEIFDLPDGGVSQIFRATGAFRGTSGWQIVRVVERRAEQQAAFEAVSGLIHREVQDFHVSRRAEEVRDLLRRRVGMDYDSTNLAWAVERFAEVESQSQPASGGPVIDISGAVPVFEPADTSRLLARWRDGRYTVGRFLATYTAVPLPQRQKVGSFRAFRTELDGYVLEPYIAELAREHGLERDSIVTTGMARKEEQIRVERLFADSVLARMRVGPEERRRYYQDHLPDYYGLPRVTFAAIARHGRAGADSVAERLRAGETAAAILRADSLAGFVSGSIRTATESEVDVFAKVLFEEMRAGATEIAGPDRQGNFLVLHKLEHDPGRQLAYEEVESHVDESVQNLEAERLLKELIARHRPGHDVRLHPELLKLVKLSDPADD